MAQTNRLLAQLVTDPKAIVGSVDKPPGVNIMSNNPSGGDIGILVLASNLIQLLVIVSSLWVILNVVSAGYAYLSSGGKTDVHTKVKDKLTMSVIGLLLIICSYTVAGLIGLIFFGDASYILNPKIPAI